MNVDQVQVLNRRLTEVKLGEALKAVWLCNDCMARVR